MLRMALSVTLPSAHSSSQITTGCQRNYVFGAQVSAVWQGSSSALGSSVPAKASACTGRAEGSGRGARSHRRARARSPVPVGSRGCCQTPRPAREAQSHLRLRRWLGTTLRSRSRTGNCLPLPSAFAKTLTSGAAFSSFPACSRFQGNKIPQARAEVSRSDVTQANNQSCSALPAARRSQPGCRRWYGGDPRTHPARAPQ